MSFLQNLYDKAFEIASKAHKGQKDRGGSPYILHPINVANRCKSDRAKVVALLHDVVEDSNVTLKDLDDAGFPKDMVIAVSFLTKKSDETYESYITSISNNELATEVKIADLQENMDITRLKKLTDKDFQRLQKYHEAYKYLTNQKQYIYEED